MTPSFLTLYDMITDRDFFKMDVRKNGEVIKVASLPKRTSYSNIYIRFRKEEVLIYAGCLFAGLLKSRQI